MKERVYLETSFIGYLTARTQRDVVVAARQTLTHEWWDEQRQNFELFVSQLVIDEASSGDAEAARERLAHLSPIIKLEVNTTAIELAHDLLLEGALPSKAYNDAVHIAVAAVNKMDYLLTWNCRHIANAVMRPVIESTCTQRGLIAPILCTPEELRKVV
jgi:predicted nucleic acid-binding protein